MTLSLLLCAAALAGPMDDLAWIEGTWRGEAEGVVMEETWSAPMADSMVGSFRFIQDDQAMFYELMIMELVDGVPTMRLKHFDPGLVGWEKRKKAVSFTLSAYETETWAVFVDAKEGKSLRYQLDGDRLSIELQDETGSHMFALERVVPTAAPLPVPEPVPAAGLPLEGLRTLGLEVTELDAAKAFFTQVLGTEPYFDQPFYVGFDIQGSELGLMPREGEGTLGAGGVSYWAVADITGVHASMLAAGASESEAPHDVGGGVMVSKVTTPQGCLLGLIEEPATPSD